MNIKKVFDIIGVLFFVLILKYGYFEVIGVKCVLYHTGIYILEKYHMVR